MCVGVGSMRFAYNYYNYVVYNNYNPKYTLILFYIVLYNYDE